MLMNGNGLIKKGLIFALAWLGLCASAHAASYYAFLKATQEAPTPEDLQTAAHLVFKNGLRRSQPITPLNASSSFYNWLTTDDDNTFITMFPSIAAAERDMRRLGPMTGLLIEVSPDNRAFNLRRSISDLIRVIPPNQGDSRGIIERFLQALVTDIPRDLVVAGMPVPVLDPDPPVIRGENIRRATAYRNDVPVGALDRYDTDGPFVENPDTPYTGWGFTFGRPSTPFPVGHIISVAPGTDNVTFVEACGPSTSSQTSRSAAPGLYFSPAKSCKNSELIDFDQFDSLHNSHPHQDAIAPIWLLLF
jgi:hypothetical protein